MNKQYRAYRRLYYLLRTILFPFFRYKIVGRENVPVSAALLCANHSSNMDPIAMSIAVGINTHMHYMAKAELFEIPVLASVLRAIGSFPVERSRTDINAIKTTLKYLKAGEKVGIFPEGKRVLNDEDGAAKRGAVKFADQMSVPVIPVYIPRHKKMFHTIEIIIGKPYMVNPDRKKLSHDDYDQLAEELMDKITLLKNAE